jgi:hypothetical protein
VYRDSDAVGVDRRNEPPVAAETKGIEKVLRHGAHMADSIALVAPTAYRHLVYQRFEHLHTSAYVSIREHT